MAAPSDPFDRMLVTQASVEELRLLSHDRVFERYGLSSEGLPPIIVRACVPTWRLRAFAGDNPNPKKNVFSPRRKDAKVRIIKKGHGVPCPFCIDTDR
jgi:hypothetical protein